MCKLCSHRDRTFTLSTISCDGPCKKIISSDGTFYASQGVDDHEHYCRVSRIGRMYVHFLAG